MRTHQVSLVCVPFSSSCKDAPVESFGLTNGETFLLKLVRAKLTPDPQVELGVVTTSDTLLECDLVIGSNLGETDTLVTAGDCSVTEGLVAADICSMDGLSICLSHWLMMNLFQADLQVTAAFLHLKTVQCLQ